MINLQPTGGLQHGELQQDIYFNNRFLISVTYKKHEVIDFLLNKVKNLEKEVNKLKSPKSLSVEDDLIKFWDNKEDAEWDTI